MNTTQSAVCRIQDFKEFHEKSCLVDSIVETLKEYCEIKKLTKKQKEDLVLLYSLTYSIPSSIVILNKIKEFESDPEFFWETNKSKIIFQSDRKYVKIDNAFVKAYFDFKGKKIFELLDPEKQLNLESCVKLLENCFFFGRFSAFLFIEAYSCVFEKEVVGFKIDWKNGQTVTSGLLNAIGRDNEADFWDKNKRLSIETNVLDKIIENLLGIVSVGKNASVMETNLCAYRKLFKGTRYLGYYSDRVLEELNQTIKNYPDCKDLFVLFTARARKIPQKYLGEVNGWSGIRKDLKSFFKKTGVWEW